MNDSEPNNSDWLQYKLMIVDRLDKAEMSQREMSSELQALQGKVGAYELCGCMFAGAVLIVLAYLKFHGMIKKNEDQNSL
ncbi:MAG: hypothetical protein KA099_10390 [Alphaproteobacteria bacterium]|nr:hypothetical protein [Alphaproteobacteria bacterium]MBP7759142.1 hypothetical protein [Alphaproteobacteria bacterium]MBP7762506.1 hypothetical protein [Alphaproteobacteria bacterium]MBP7905722.1 hypothetical protein [Alphaproteobacteria bacterium]